MNLRPGAHLPDGPLKLWQLAGLFVAFSFPLLWAVLGLFEGRDFGWLPSGASYLLLGLLVVTWVLGVVKGFPLWALPGLGVLLFLVSFLLKFAFQALVLILTNPPGTGFWPDSIQDRLILYFPFNLAYVIIAALIVVLLLSISKSFSRQAREDWTLVSFLMYGLSIPYVTINDPYRGLAPFELAGILFLMAGAALFLMIPGRRQRLVVLLLATCLAHSVLSLGIYRIFPEQEFAVSIQSFRLWESLQPVLDLPALLILLCLPVLLPRLPAASGRKLAAYDL